MVKRPEWFEAEHDEAFASYVMNGIEQPKAVATARVKVRREQTIEELAAGVRANNRTILAQAITLIESNAAKHVVKAQALIDELLPYTGNAFRIGITGVPGAGKSTFIEALGLQLVERGHRVAVLAVDPSSTLTGGSILGDKTRMEQLARHEFAFIRPSPSSGTLGGVHRKTRETIALCEAAGYDIVLIETVGVGQSEVVVRSMVDFFLLLVLTGAGDELQGMKKGIMELVDAIIVHKADGHNELHADIARAQYEQILHYIRPATEGWLAPALTCSSVTKKGLNEAWEMMERFVHETKASEQFAERRSNQAKEWMMAMIHDYLAANFFGNEAVKRTLSEMERAVTTGNIAVSRAVVELLQTYERNR